MKGETNFIKEKSFRFAIRIVHLHKLLQYRSETVLSKQLLRSGTSVGALIRESEQAESRADFIHKLSIALKEADETEYWLALLHETEYLNEKGVPLSVCLFAFGVFLRGALFQGTP